MSPRRATRALSVWDDPRFTQLSSLRKGSGATASKLAQRPELLRLLGCSDPTQGLAVLRERVSALIGDKHFAALHNALGFGASNGPQLQERRQHYADAGGRSADTIRDWEDQALGELLLMLLSAQPLPPTPQPNFLLERLAIKYRNQDRHFVDAQHQRDLVVLATEVDSFRYSVDETIEIDSVRGATLRLEDRTPAGTLYRFMFPKRLLRGDRHSFSFREFRPASVAPTPTEVIADRASQLFQMPASTFDVSVDFLGPVPPVIWKFRQMPLVTRPGEPNTSNRLRPDSRGRVSASFTQLHGGLASGIAWRW